MQDDRDVVRQCAVLTAVLAGALSGATGDYDDADTSSSPVVPADEAFVIWLPVYAGLLAYATDQALPSRRTSPVHRRTGWPVAVAVGLSGAWVRLQHRPRAQLVTIAATTAAALVAHVRAQPTSAAEASSRPQAWLVRGPLGLLAGWLTLATGAATTEVLAVLGARAPGGRTDATGAALLASISVLAWLTARATPRSPGYPVALAWGLAGVAVRGRRRWPVSTATAAGAAVTLLATAVVMTLRGPDPSV